MGSLLAKSSHTESHTSHWCAYPLTMAWANIKDMMKIRRPFAMSKTLPHTVWMPGAMSMATLADHRLTSITRLDTIRNGIILIELVGCRTRNILNISNL